MHEAEERLVEHKKALEEERSNHRAKVSHTGLEPRASRPQAGLLLTHVSLALDNSRRRRPNPNPNPNSNPNPEPLTPDR